MTQPLITEDQLNLGIGTGPNNIVRLDGSGKLPAVDGSQLTNVGISSWTFESVGNAVPAVGGQTSYAHGLGSAPSEYQLALVCNTAEHGYGVGDIIIWGQVTDQGGVDRTVSADATNVHISQAGGNWRIQTRSGASTVNITTASWDLTVRAR